MLEAIAGLLTSGGLGAIAGLFGSIVTGITNYKMQKLKNDHDILMIKAETDAIKIEADANIRVTKAEVEGRVEIAEVEALKESYKSLSQDAFKESYMDKMFQSNWTAWIGALAAFLFAIVDFLKKLARPILTYYHVILTTWVAIVVYGILEKAHGEAITPDEAFKLFQMIVNVLLFLTVSCVTYWFVDRRTAKFLMRLQDGNIGKEGSPL
jgi:ABC-type multidrug transport system fused ATPase/permease subunit